MEVGRKSKYTDEIIVSTDSCIIKSIAEQYGANVPFLRPDKLSNDSTKSIDVVLHVMEFYKNNNITFDYIILLQPTSPLRTFKHVDEAIEKLMECNRASLVSMCKAEENPIFMRSILNGKLKEIMKFEGTNFRRQDIPAFYIFNGAIYINSYDMLIHQKQFVDENTMPYIMNKESSTDIDTFLDARLVEVIIKENMNV
jgi:CMP-N,N'-diacetyllegionaminic acid synthase